jgi:hypothetical protein
MAVILSCAHIGSAVTSDAMHGQIQEAGDPVWTVDLRGHGYEVYSDGQAPQGSDKDLAFRDNGEMVVLGYTSKVRAFVIDTQSGRVVRTRDWIRRGDSAVFATSEGNYAVLDGGTILYGPGLVDEVFRSPHFVSMVSPNGRRFAARTNPVRGTVWIAIDADTLAESGTLPHFYDGTLAEQSTAQVVLRAGQGPSVEIATMDKTPAMYQPNWGKGRPYFVSENVLVVRGPERFDVITIDGQRLFTEPGGWNDGTHISTSRDGRRMAVTRERYSGHWQLLKSEQVTVFDLEAKRAIWTVKNKEMKGSFSDHSGIALSPDGSLLAIHSRGIVKIFRVPHTAVE